MMTGNFERSKNRRRAGRMGRHVMRVAALTGQRLRGGFRRQRCWRWSWLGQQSDLNGVALDASQHPAEHQVMERKHRVPVDQTEQPAGPEQSCLVEDALAFVTWFYSEVEQRFAR
jgi:hypothetical protein